MPGPEKPLLHIAIEFVEMLDNALAEHQMLNVAHGESPAEAACIIDVPIEAVALPCAPFQLARLLQPLDHASLVGCQILRHLVDDVPRGVFVI